jgi:hypothetical protein
MQQSQFVQRMWVLLVGLFGGSLQPAYRFPRILRLSQTPGEQDHPQLVHRRRVSI